MTQITRTIRIQSLLGHAFPWMAISGLLLAGWGLIITPDEMKNDSQWAHSSMPSGAVIAWIAGASAWRE